MRFPSPTSFRTAVALVASVSAAGCSFFTGIPDVDRVELSVAPRVINVGQGAVAFGTAFNGRSVVNHSKRQVRYTSSDAAVATINPASGQIVGLSVGVAYITAEAGGKQARDSIIVRLVPARSVLISGSRTPRFRLGALNGLGALVRDSLGNGIGDRKVTWRSSNEAVLTVADGLVTPRSLGTAQITATVDNGLGGGPSVADTVTATVTPTPIAAVRIDPVTATRVVGETQQFTLTLTDSLGATVTGRALTWSSSNPTVASVTSAGLASALVPGQADIRVLIDRVPGEPTQLQGGSTLVVVAPASASTFSNQTAVSLRVGQSVVLAVGVRDASGNTLRNRAIVLSPGYDPNVVQVAFSGDYSQATFTGRTAGSTTVTLQARDPSNQQDQGTPVAVQVTVNP